MSTCPKCHNKRTVSLKNKLYCANCGQPLGKSDLPKPVLDLTKHHAKPKPAVSEVSPAHAAKRRVAHAHQTKRNPSISKFGNLGFKKTATKSSGSKAMSAHRSYAIHGGDKSSSIADKAAYIMTPAANLTKLSAKDIDRLTTDPRSQRSPLLQWLSVHRRIAISGPIVLAALLITAYVSYLNIPIFSLRVAAMKAGLSNASLPASLPPGFGYSGPIKVSSHHAIVAHAIGPNGQTLDISEQSTSYIDTQSLIENFIKPLASCQVSIDQCINEHTNNGLTVIVYNRNNAAWIYGSILYSIGGHNSLTADQVLALATSF